MIQSAQIFHVAVPLKQSFAHARSSRDLAESIVVLVRDGCYEGVGESVPREYVTLESIESAFLAIENIDWRIFDEALAVQSFEAAILIVGELNLAKRFAEGSRLGLAAACAVETAVLDLLGKKFARSLKDLPRLYSSVEFSSTISVPPPMTAVIPFDRDPRTYADRVPSKVQRVKLKVGRDEKEDCANLCLIRKLFGTEILLYVDANMAWSLKQALKMELMFREFNIAWYEEPLAKGALDDYCKFRNISGAKISLDESLCSIEDAQIAIARKACDIFNIRISKCGGLINSSRIAELARLNNIGIALGAQVGQMGVLAAADWNFVLASPDLLACEGLTTPMSLKESIVVEPLAIHFPTEWATVVGTRGLGITIDKTALNKFVRRSLDWARSPEV